MPQRMLCSDTPLHTNNSSLLSTYFLTEDLSLLGLPLSHSSCYCNSVSSSKLWLLNMWAMCPQCQTQRQLQQMLREALKCIKDQHSILLNEPHNLAGLLPTSISISSINRRQNNSSFLCLIQPLIVPDQILFPRGYSFCSIGNCVLDKMQELLSANLKCSRKARRCVSGLLKTLTNHITALALMELTKHCWEQHGHSSDQRTLAGENSCLSEWQQIHKTTVRSEVFSLFISAP